MITVPLELFFLNCCYLRGCSAVKISWMLQTAALFLPSVVTEDHGDNCQPQRTSSFFSTPFRLLCRLADDSLYVAHPLMFKPVVEHKYLQPLQPADGQSLTEAALLEAQKLTIDDVLDAEAHLGKNDVRPVPLKAVLNTCDD